MDFNPGKAEVEYAGATKRKFEDMAGGPVDENEVLKHIREEDISEIDVNQLRKMISDFDNAFKTNMKLRMKHADEPNRFMESEIHLDECIQALHPILAVPKLYPEFVKYKMVSKLLELLSHENLDIAYESITLINKLTDPEVIEEDEEAMSVIESLTSTSNLKQLVSFSTGRLGGKEDSDVTALYDTLSIYENIVDLKPNVCEEICSSDVFMRWILSLIGKYPKEVTTIDQNTLYASELLMAIIQQAKPTGQAVLADLKAIPMILGIVKTYAEAPPGTVEDVEFCANLFGTLCVATNTHIQNQLSLAAHGGIPPLLQMIKQKKDCKTGALKTIYYAIERCPEVCVELVNAGGLKTVFSALMNKGKQHKKFAEFNDLNEEYIVSIIAQLFINLKDIPYLRLLRKFQEQEFEKVDRMVELYVKYFDQVGEKETEFKKENPKPSDVEEKEEWELYLLQTKLENGLFTLQQIALVLSFVMTAGEKDMRERVEQLLNQQDMDTSDLVHILKDYIGELDTSDETSWPTMTHAIVTAMLKMIESGV